MQPLDLIGSFEERKFSDFRNPTIDTLIWGSKRHHIPILLEIDVTAARDAIREQKKKTGQSISFTAWIVKCIAQAVSEYKSIHALRKGKRRLIIFDDVDVAVIVERAVGQPGVRPRHAEPLSHAAARPAGDVETFGIDRLLRNGGVDDAHQIVEILARIRMVDEVAELAAIGCRTTRV